MGDVCQDIFGFAPQPEGNECARENAVLPPLPTEIELKQELNRRDDLICEGHNLVREEPYLVHEMLNLICEERGKLLNCEVSQRCHDESDRCQICKKAP